MPSAEPRMTGFLQRQGRDPPDPRLAVAGGVPVERREYEGRDDQRLQQQHLDDE